MKITSWSNLVYLSLQIYCICCIKKEGRLLLRQQILSENSDFRLLLQDVVLNNLHPNKCVTVICDYIYYHLFKREWFRKFDIYLSFILILIEDNEDLYAPYNETQIALLTAKNDGCQAYIILIANGIQVSRLLRFGDKYRVLDTRARFLLLYDQRLFEKNLHYLWKRIVNVIFIKEVRGSRGGKKDEHPWFEISTVPFPSPITTIFVPRRLDIWRDKKFRNGADLFRDKTSDIKNQTLKVVVFEHIPAISKMPIAETKSVRTVVRSGTDAYTGLELEILQSVSDAMNFVFELYEPEDSYSDLWGKKEQIGHYTGMFGEMVKGNADFALGDLYYASSVLELMDLTVPYNAECLTFLTPEALSDNSWKTLILPFTPYMWLAVIICLIVSGFIFFAIARFHFHVNQIKYDCMKKQKELLKRRKVITLSVFPSPEKIDSDYKYTKMKEQYQLKKFEGQPEGIYLFGELLNSFLYTYSMLLLVSIPKLPTGWSLRIMTGWYWLYCTLVVVAYRASMTAILATPSPRVTIDTLQQLVDSKLSCGGRGDINRDFFQTSLDPASKIIGSHFEMVNNSDVAVDRVANGKFAFYENVYFLKDASFKRQTRLDGGNASENQAQVPKETFKADRNLHIMIDCVINMPISLGLQKNSPIKPRVDKFIRRALEAGLVKKWLDDVMQATTANVKLPSEEKSTKALMNMQKFFGALVVLLIGYFIGIVALVIEIVYYNYFVKIHPDYDKYSRNIHLKNK